MPHGMPLNTMALQITRTQVEGLLPEAKKAFLDGLQEFWTDDGMAYLEDFGNRLPIQVWEVTDFYVSTKGYVRALQPNDVVMVWDAQTGEWEDNDHDD
jgi:hypothetical protein